MMSYLWILLLGSLLATSAKAQDDVAPTEEAAGDPETPAPDADTEPVLNGEPDADEEAKHTAEEIPPVLNEPEPITEPTVTATEAPADGDAELAAPKGGDAEPTPEGDDAELAAPEGDDAEPTPAGDDTEPTPAVDDVELAAPEGDDTEPTPAADDAEPTPAGDDAELAAPAGDDTEPTPAAVDAEPTPAGDNSEPAAPANGDTEPSTPMADTEVEAAATTKAPADNVEEEEDPASTSAAPAQEESGPGDKATSGTDQTVKDNEEEPTDPVTDADEIVDETVVPDTRKEVNVPVLEGEDDVPDMDKDGDTLSEPNRRRSFDLEAIAAGTQGDADKPQARASSGTLAGILCAIGVAAVGAVTGYFTYQRKQLCFKNRQEADPEAARKADAAEAQSDPQVLSNLLNSS